MKKALLFIVIIILVVLGWYYFGGQDTSELSVWEKELAMEQEINTPEEFVGTYTVNEEETTLTWGGARIVGLSHTGEVPVKSSTIDITTGGVVGEVVFDVVNITSDNERLTGHLKTADFFDVEAHPEAVYRIDGIHTDMVTGTLVIKGNQKSNFVIPVIVTETETGLRISGETVIDRTEFGITYESGNFFQELGDKAISDDVDISFELTLDK